MLLNDNIIDQKAAMAYSPLTLAYLGDCVYELLVREKLVLISNRSNCQLHREAINFVSAKAQCRFMQKIMCELTEDETYIYKRGRNSNAVPNKNTDLGEYITATGLETLFGYLYLTGKTDRIEELFNKMTE